MKKLVPYTALSSASSEEKHYDSFFANLIEGDVFLYRSDFCFHDVKKLASKRGVEIESLNCSETNGEFGARVC